MRALLVVLAAAALQEPEEPAAVRLHRALEARLKTEGEGEVRRRLSDLRDLLRDRVATTLTGEPATPDDAPVVRMHDPRNLVAPLRDRPFPRFWEVRLHGGAPAGFPEEPLEPAIGEEQIVDLIRERVAPGTWEGNQTIEKTPSGQLLIQARPSIQRRVARLLRVLEAETRLEWRIAVEVIALADPPPLPADGVLEAADFKRLQELAAAGESARRLGAFEITAPAAQRVSAFSGREVELVVGHDPDGPRRAAVLDGLCAEFRLLPGGEGHVHVHARLGFRKLLGVEEVATAKGAVQSPRLAETGFSEESRLLPVGRPCVLGLLGPLSEESKLPPYLVVIARLDPRR